MDLTSLLNTAGGIRPAVPRESLEHTPTPTPSIDISTAPSTALPTPSPERSPSRRSSESRSGAKSRTPWDAGGYSLPLSLDTKLSPTNSKPSYYSESPLDAHPTSAISALSVSSIYHSRSNSLESSPIEMVASGAISPITTSQVFRPTFLGEGEPHLEIAAERRPSIASETEAQLTARRPSFLMHNEMSSNTGSPKSPKHKFSDSHSSLSSYSSSQSGGHSRISSMSTVSGGLQPLSSLLSDITPIDEKVEGKNPMGGGPILGEVQPPSPNPATSRDGLPPRLPSLSIAMDRPRSPSDAFLINRGDSNRASPIDPNGPQSFATHTNFANFQLQPQQPSQGLSQQYGTQPPTLPSLSSLPRPIGSSISSLHPPQPVNRHKRAISAPNFAGFAPPIFNSPVYHSQPQTFGHPPFMMPGQPGAPPPGANGMSATPNTNGSGNASTGSQRARNLHLPCEYVANCDTNTDRRKLISHIFGRNKLCTRQIPDHIWIHYCRKHYQRSRYRNQAQYARHQGELVLNQMKRIHAWSEENRNNGTPGVVRSYELASRKREDERQRNAQTARGDDDDPHSIPDWLRSKIGSNKSYDEMMAILQALQNELCQANSPVYPDIEILPDIDTEPRRGSSRRRGPGDGGNAHRRSMSCTDVGASRAEKRKRDDQMEAGNARRHCSITATIPEESEGVSSQPFPPVRSHSRSRSEIVPNNSFVPQPAYRPFSQTSIPLRGPNPGQYGVPPGTNMNGASYVPPPVAGVSPQMPHSFSMTRHNSTGGYVQGPDGNSGSSSSAHGGFSFGEATHFTGRDQQSGLPNSFQVQPY